MKGQLAVSGDPVIIRRHDIESLLEHPKPDRDQLVLSLPAKMGMRTSEIRFLHNDQIDLDEGCLYVLDSKKHKKYPIPMPWDVSKLLAKVMDPYKPYVVRPDPQRKRPRTPNRPVGRGYIYYLTRKWAVRAGLPNWDQVTTTLLRHYFAATWTYDLKGSTESLRRIMRHKNLQYTQIYLGRLVFFEDLQDEVNRLRQIPNLEGGTSNISELEYQSSDFFLEYCRNCVHLSVCKYSAEACASSDWSTGCKRFLKRMEVKARVVQPET